MKSILVSISLIVVFNLNAAVYTVTSSSDNVDAPSEGMLRYFINNSTDGDVILFAVSSVTLAGELRISGKLLTIDGGDGVILDGNHVGQIFNISCYSGDVVTLKNLTFQNGRDEGDYAWGGAIYAFLTSGDLQVENCTFKDNEAIATVDGQGGAIRTDGGTFKNCFFLNNKVSGTTSVLGGGAIFALGAKFINCVVAGNQAVYGGGIYASNTEFINCTVTQNSVSAADNGGGVNCEDNCTFVNTIIYNNQANGIENSIENYLNSSTFQYCALENSNALVGSGGNIGLTESPFTHAGNDSLSIPVGSACEDKGTTNGVEVLSKDIIGKARVKGAAIDIGAYEYSPPTYDAITVTNNSGDPTKEYSLPWAVTRADSAAVITFDNDYTIYLSDNIFLENTITIDGSGHQITIDGSGETELFHTMVTKADTFLFKNLIFKNAKSNYSGGAIVGYNSGAYHFNLINCVFDNNFTWGQGGGFSTENTATVINCTFLDNTSGWQGSATHCKVKGEFENCLFYNTKPGKYPLAKGECTFKNCAADEFLAGENNVRLWSSPVLGGTGSDRYHLSEESFCANAGKTSTLTNLLGLTDIAGNPRIMNDTIDIGAVESDYMRTPEPVLFGQIEINNASFDVDTPHSLLWALRHADDGCVISFNDSFTINVCSEILLGEKSLTIDGGDHQIVLDGGDSSGLIIVNGYSEKEINIKSLTLQNGNGYYGGGISIDLFKGGFVNLTSLNIQHNQAQRGGGIYVKPRFPGNNSFSMVNSVVFNNYARSEGGGFYYDGNTHGPKVGMNRIINCTLSKNSAGGRYGGAFSQGEIELINCLFYDNPTGSEREIWFINGSEIIHCAAETSLGGLGNIKLYSSPFKEETLLLKENSYCSNAGTPNTTGLNLPSTDLTDSARITKDTIDIGAYESQYSSAPKVKLYDEIVVQNNSFDVEVENSLLWALKHIKPDGQIKFDSDYTIPVSAQIVLGDKGVTIDGGSNNIILDGGDSTEITLIENDLGWSTWNRVYLKNIAFQKGYSAYGGGALRNDLFSNSRIHIENCLFVSNNSKRYGGAVYVEESVRFNNCIFIGNSSMYGGAAYFYRDVEAVNCTFTKNNCKQLGSAIQLWESKLTNCVSYDNISDFYSNDDFYIRSESEFRNCASGYDLTDQGEGNILLTQSPFKNNGLVDSLSLPESSILFNAGTADTSGLKLALYDFTGNNRITGDTVDIGAYEYFDFVINSIVKGKGKITPAIANLIEGADKTIRITPASGYVFDSLWVDDVFVDSTESYSFYNIQANHVLKASFLIDTFDITGISPVNGTFNLQDTTLTVNDTVDIKIIPEPGYVIEAIKINNHTIEAGLIKNTNYYLYQLSGITEDSEIEIIFTLGDFSIEFVSNGLGDLIYSSNLVTYADSITVSLIPNYGHTIKNIVFGGADVLDYSKKEGSNFIYTIKDVLSDDTLSVEFVPDTFSISIETKGLGTVTPADTTLIYGESIKFIIRPEDANYINVAKFGLEDVLPSLLQEEDYFTFSRKNIGEDIMLYVEFVKEGQIGIPSNSITEIVRIYPNPAAEFLKVEPVTSVDLQNTFFQLINMSGKVVCRKTIHSDSPTLDVSGYPRGVYILRVFNSNAEILINSTIELN